MSYSDVDPYGPVGNFPTASDEVLLNFIEQSYLVGGQLPTFDRLKEVGFTRVHYNFMMGKSARGRKYKENLILRGVSENCWPEEGKPLGVLSELQLTAANVMLDLRDNRSQRKKLSELGISTGMWDKWLKDPAFQSYLRERAENLLGDNQHEAHYSLLMKVRAGDISAIKYFNEMTGRFVQQKAGVESGFDTKMLLTRVIETIQKHVKDPEVQKAIADDLIGYAQATGFVQQLTSIPIPIPVGAQVEPERKEIEVKLPKTYSVLKGI